MRRITCLALALIIITAALPAYAAEYLILPADTRRIEAEAFAGDASAKFVIIPDGTEHIGARAFACSGVETVSFPASVKFIDDTAFDDCGDIEYIAPNGSYALAWCAGHLYAPAATDSGAFDYRECEGGIIITGYCGDETDIVIPAEIDGTPVREIDEYAFWYNDLIETVYIGGIEKIWNFAFYGCTGLETVILGEGLACIGEDCFSGCEALEDVRLPSTITRIGASAFAGCGALKELTIPGGVEAVSTKVFQGCASLESVMLGSGITSIEDYAFQGCDSLRAVHVPASCRAIADTVFDLCASDMITVYGAEGSFADSFAAAHGMPFAAE